MGYRHYVGYIPKKDLPEIMKEVERLKSLIGTPRGDDEDDTYSQYDITSYLQDKTTEILGVGKLYYKNTESIYDALYKNKGKDFSNDDTEFFFVNGNTLLLDVAFAQMGIWADLMRKWESIINKILNKEKLTMDEDCELLEISELFKQEYKSYEYAVKAKEKGTNLEWLKPYLTYQFNYSSVETYQKHMNFDYENNAICVFAY